MKRMRKAITFLLTTALTASMLLSQMLIPSAVENTATISTEKVKVNLKI